MPKTLRDKYAKKEEDYRKKLLAEKEREKDMIYELWFIRKGSNHNDSNEKRYFPRESLFGNPKDYPDEVDEAIKRFQNKNNVADWREIAEKHEVVKFWNP